MSTSVLLACELNEQKLPPFVLIQENSGADASFLVASLIGNCLKYQQNGVVLVCLHHISQHYTSAAARLGFNISVARDKGRCVIAEPLTDIGQNFLTSTFLSEPKAELLESLLLSIKADAEQQLNDKGNVTIIIDSISTLVDLGCSKESVLQFCHRLINLANDRISIVLKINTSNLYEDFVSSLEDYANSDYLITKMKSGEFHEVDGKIIYKKRSDFRHISKTILYKVGDKNIKIFQPGEIGVRA
ncbi:uncharacterized protein LOC129565079 [Sitodiplosis mosellana]|uniref:uncharacterized protein LOC129565079 n=1 Tax=Sitodiplosis mosellana TaxID=263140 RepID=UPI002444FF18|nr:uncharacterized protein LOC129565079 [Sitodiplosis mosellana]